MSGVPGEWLALERRIDPCQPTDPPPGDIIAYLRKLTEAVIEDFEGMLTILDQNDLTLVTWDYDFDHDETGDKNDVDYAVHMYDLVDSLYNPITQ